MTSPKPSAFQLKGSLFTLTVMHLLSTDFEIFKTQLTTLIKQTPKFFHHIPMVLDLQKIQDVPAEQIDFSALVDYLRQHTIIPVGVRGGSATQHSAATLAGLAILPNTKAETTDHQNNKNESVYLKPATSKTINSATTVNTKIITQPVRSGQQIYARQSDLVILAPVSPGAELLADGNIHVYAPLRGRALAGVNGNTQARIFCQNLDAELISIAGHYWVSEDIHKNPIKENVHIYLENERLHVTAL